MTPHSRPPTVIGVPTDRSLPAGRPVRRTSAATCSPSIVTRRPPTPAAVPSGSKRSSWVVSAPSSRRTSTVTAPNSSSGGTARATSVATRRSAACSSASTRSSSRLSCSEPAMVLNARSSVRTSPTPVSGTRVWRSPAASRPAIRAARRTGSAIARVR